MPGSILDTSSNNCYKTGTVIIILHFIDKEMEAPRD